MEKLLMFFTSVVIICFGSWAVLGTLSGFPKAWIIMFVGMTILISGIVALYILPKQSLAFRDQTVPLNAAIKFLVTAAILNSVGNFLFSTILVSRSDYTQYYVLVIMAGVPISAWFSQYYFRKVEFTSLTIPAMVVIVLGIYMLMLNNKQIDSLKKIFHH